MSFSAFNQTLGLALDHAWYLINQQQGDKALIACRQLNIQYPASDEGWFATSFLAFQMRQGFEALQAIDKALQLAPTQSRWLLHKAHTLLVLGRQSEALILVEPLASQTYQQADLCAELALVLNKLSRFEQAGDYYRMAIALTDNVQQNNKTLAQLFFNLGSIERYLGNIDAAEASLDQAIGLNSEDPEAWLLRSSLRKQTDQKNHVSALEAMIRKGGGSPLGQAQLNYALAKELEDLDRCEPSFAALSQGASVRRKYMQYDVNNDIATIDKIIEVFDKQTFARSINGFDSPAPIFILGLPRTGSTLIERILSSHSEVYSAGELNNFALQMMAQVKHLGQPTSKLELVGLTRQLDFAQLGKAYVQSTKPQTAHTSFFIDKLPLNSLYAGLIHLALPHAKIIHVKRHPLDTCYAIYKQLFTNGYPFSYDLHELADYYIAHHRLMAHWHEVMPAVIYDVHYEAVVEDVEGQARALIDHCGLPWQQNCGEFHKNAAPSTTASATQVRQGIYQSSKHRWLQYQTQLAPLKIRLEQAGIACELPTMARSK